MTGLAGGVSRGSLLTGIEPPVVHFENVGMRYGLGPEVLSDVSFEIAPRSFSTFIRTEVRETIFDTYRFARSNGMGFNISYIGKDIPEPKGEGFDTAYMRRLYEYGYAKARSGTFWEKRPPNEAAPVSIALR